MKATNSGIPTQASSAGFLWLKLSVIYLIVGVAMGIFMGASHDMTLRPVHAHVNLLGFTTLALAGLIYSVFPDAGASRLAKVHLMGKQALLPALIVSEFMAAGGVLAFAANVFLNLRRA
jgi:hypothetical protein